MPFQPPGNCPICGTWVRKGAHACPECGADAMSGWKDEAATDGLDLPDENFDYESFLEEEFGKEGGRVKPKGLHPAWWVTGLIILTLFAYGVAMLMTAPAP